MSRGEGLSAEVQVATRVGREDVAPAIAAIIEKGSAAAADRRLDGTARRAVASYIEVLTSQTVENDL